MTVLKFAVGRENIKPEILRLQKSSLRMTL